MTIVAFVRNIQYFGIAVLIQTGLSDLHDLTRDILIDSCLLLLLFCFIFVLFLLFLMGGGAMTKYILQTSLQTSIFLSHA